MATLLISSEKRARQKLHPCCCRLVCCCFRGAHVCIICAIALVAEQPSSPDLHGSLLHLHLGMSTDNLPLDMSNMSYKELREKCREHGLSIRGRSEALRSRLDAALSKQHQTTHVLPVQMSTSSAMEALLSEPCYSDVRFVAGPEASEISAHRALLALHSEVLKTMMQVDCQETQRSTITLPDVSPSTVRAFLRLCYCGSTSGSEAELISLLKLCHLYQAQAMVIAVVEALAGGLRAANALQLYAVGCMYSETLKGKALAYISVDSQDVFDLALHDDSSALSECTQEQLQELLSRDELGISEEDVYRVVLKWGRCHQEESQPPLSQLASELWPCVRWSLMSPACLQAIGSEGVVPQEVVVPHLFKPSTGLHCSRSWASPPEDTSRTFWLQHAYSSDHHVYVWQRPIGDKKAVSPHFHVGGLKFQVTSALENKFFNLAVLVPSTVGEKRLVIMRCSGMCRAGKGKWNTTVHAAAYAHLTTVGGVSQLGSYSECYSDATRLFGPDQEHLRLQIDVQVEGDCKLRMLKSPDADMQVFELKVPAIVLDLEHVPYITVASVEAFHLSWKVIFYNGAAGLFVLADGQPDADKEYTCNVTLMPPANSSSFLSLPHASFKVGLRKSNKSWSLRGQVRLKDKEPHLTPFVWSSQEIVLRCDLQVTPRDTSHS